MEMLPFVLLTAALALFLVSTNQWKLWLRGVIVLAGFALLVGAGLVTGHHTLLSGLTDLSGSGDGSLAARWKENQAEIGGYVLSMVDLFVVLGVLLGVIAVIAFTPGDALERVLRPVMVALVGAVLGGALASFVIGIGLNAPPLRPVLINLQHDDIKSGDTIVIEQRGIRYPVRLAGIDAPEIMDPPLMNQVCWSRVGSDCGVAAREHLWEIVQRAGLLSCHQAQTSDNAPPVTCVGTGPNATDIAREMVHDGYAMGEGDYAADFADAKGAYRGLLGQCALAPSEWRRMNPDAQRRFAGDPRRRPARAALLNPDPRICQPAAVSEGQLPPYVPPRN